jgi:predicted XRE-type DNA-binding protein
MITTSISLSRGSGAPNQVDGDLPHIRSGNVFADLGLTNPEEKQIRVRLAPVINQIIQSRALSRAIAARHLKVNQPKVSALSNYRLDGFFR